MICCRLRTTGHSHWSQPLVTATGHSHWSRATGHVPLVTCRWQHSCGMYCHVPSFYHCPPLYTTRHYMVVLRFTVMHFPGGPRCAKAAVR